MKEADSARFKFPFGSDERAMAEYLYQEALKEHSDAKAYFRFVAEEADAARMHARASKRVASCGTGNAAPSTKGVYCSPATARRPGGV